MSGLQYRYRERRAKKKKKKSHVCPWYNDIPSIFDIMPGSNPRPACIIEKATIDLSPDPCNPIALYSNPIPKRKSRELTRKTSCSNVIF